MGVGRLVWTFDRFQAVEFTEAQSLKLNDAAFGDLSTGDFRIAVLAYIDSSLAGSYAALLTKYDGDLASDTGWSLLYIKANNLIQFSCNDGDVAGSGFVSSNNAATPDAWNWIVVEGDRDGNLTIFVNGVSVHSSSMSAATGSLDKATEHLTISRSNTLLGKIGYAALGSTIYGSDYALEEYYAIFNGLPRRVDSWDAVWTFDNSLWDLGGQYVFSYEPSGAPAFVDGFPTSMDLSLTYNFTFQYELDYAPLDAVFRAEDGTGLLYAGPEKRRLVLPFDFMSKLQAVGLEGAWVHRSPIDVYLDQDKPLTLTGMMVAPPQMRRQSALWWSGQVELEEL